MLQIDQSSDLWAALQDAGPQSAFLLFEIRYAAPRRGYDPVEYFTTKPGAVTIGDITYQPFRIPLQPDPPQRASGSVDQDLMGFAIGPRSEVEMQVELAKWTGQAYPQDLTRDGANLPGIAMTIKIAFETGRTREREVLSEVWLRDTPVRRIPITVDLTRAWIDFTESDPPEIGIAPLQLPESIWTATRGGATVAPEPVFFQRLRYNTSAARDKNALWLSFGTSFSL